MTAEKQQLLRAPDVGELLGYSTARVYQLARAGKLPVVHYGRSVLFPRAAVEQLLEEESAKALAGMARSDSEAGEL